MTTHLPHPKYRSDIDGLRALAVLAVVIFHAFPTLVRGGFIGVDIFFVISGYLISTIVFKSLDEGSFTFSEFYARRVKRIFPALILVLAFCFFVGWTILLPDEFKQLGKHIAAGAGFVANLVLWSEAGYFDNSAATKPLLHLWSLGIEEQFYIAWPLLLWFISKWRFNTFFVTMMIFTISVVWNLLRVKLDSVGTFYSPQTRFWELLSGSLLAWSVLYKGFFIGRNGNELDEKINSKININTICSCVGLLLLFYGFMRINESLSYPGKWALVPTLGAVLIIASGPKAWVNRWFLSSKLMVWFGLISFPLYLWHWPLLAFARIFEGEMPSVIFRLIAVALSVFFAWSTYVFVERPMRFGISFKNKTTMLSVSMVLIGAVGFSADSFDGYGFRSSVQGFVNNKSELARTPAIDDACLAYVGLKKPLVEYCRFTNANSIKTVAVIGDSHAHVAYPGISEFLQSQGVNTLLLANNGCPAFLGNYPGSNQADKDACGQRVQQLFEIIKERKDISKVFIFSRGPKYITGTEPVTGETNLVADAVVPLEVFSMSAQLMFDELSKNGKSVFYVTENPELIHSSESCLPRPFKTLVRNCSVEKSTVLRRQRDYLEAFSGLQNVTVINSLLAFCPESQCIVFDDKGALLYADDDHLSVAGSRFQVNQLLKFYLN